MKKFILTSAALLSAFALNAQDVVLPEGMVKLTSDGVELTSTGLDNKTTNLKPIVKTSNNLIFFTAKNADAGEELWISGLTPETTKIVKDIYPGAESSNPTNLVAVGNKVFFVATTPDAGAELWVSDGTSEGTKMVKDIYPGDYGSSPFGLSKYGDKVMFFAMDEESEAIPTIGTDPEKWLWISDGTESGTVRLGTVPTREGNYDGDAGVIVEANGLAFFVGYNSEMNETLYVSDGTEVGTKPVKNINPRKSTGNFETESAAIDWITPAGNKVVFRAETVSEVTGSTDMGSEIWVSDGTEAGTQWIGFDFAKGEVDGKPRGTQFACSETFGDVMYFRADDGVHGVEPCVFYLNEPIEDGKNPKTLADINHWGNHPEYHSWPSNYHIYDGFLFMQANGGYFLNDNEIEYGSGQSLWRMNPETNEALYTKQYCDFEIYTGNKRDNCCWLTTVGSKMFLSAQDQDNNMELWMVENADAAPSKVLDLPDNGQPHSFIVIDDNLYFASMGTKALYRYIVEGEVPEGNLPSGLVSNKVYECKVYPSVTEDLVNIDSSENVSSVEVYTLQGSLVYSCGNTDSISLAAFDRGIYLVKVVLENGGNFISKIVLE